MQAAILRASQQAVAAAADSSGEPLGEPIVATPSAGDDVAAQGSEAEPAAAEGAADGTAPAASAADDSARGDGGSAADSHDAVILQ